MSSASGHLIPTRAPLPGALAGHPPAGALEALPGAVLSCARDGTLLEANAEARRLFGTLEGGIAAVAARALRHDGSACPASEHPVLRCLATGEPQTGTLLGYRSQDAEVVWVVHAATPLRDPDGAICGALLTCIDVTWGPGAVAVDERRYRALVEGSPDPMAILDGARLLYANAAAARLVGARDARDLTGRSFVELVHPESRATVLDRARRVMQEGEILPPAEIKLVRLDGGVVEVEVNGAPIRYGGHTANLTIGRDVTARKEAERRLRALEARIHEAQKLESLGLLAGGVAHDFNNLLTAILGHVELARAALGPRSPALEHLERVDAAAHVAAELTHQMLAYSGKGRFVVESVDLSRLVSELAELLRTVVSRKARLELELDGALPRVAVDVAQIRQLVMNLITNASDALAGAPGVITIRTGLAELDPGRVPSAHAGTEPPPGAYVFLDVEDTGVGMDEATRARIFDPFFTTKATGRGLGLAAALGIVRGHRGALEVESRPGDGSRFRVWLPPATLEVEPRTRGEPARRARSATVLVVDDEARVREVTRMLLEHNGYGVITAAGGRAAIAAFAARPEIGVVLLDLTMPDLGGDEVLQALRRIRSEVPVVLTSGYAELDVTERLGGLSADGFLQKPYSLEHLLDVLGAALSKRA